MGRTVLILAVLAALAGCAARPSRLEQFIAKQGAWLRHTWEF
jgi:type IV pilus biogenesis protein CpaD/CtpE